LDAFLGRLRLSIDAETGSVWSQPYINNRLDAVLLKQSKKIVRLPAAVANGAALFVHGSVSILHYPIATGPGKK
jgi:hypothetical protein